MQPCPRCGHDNPADPTRRPDGDHAVLLTTPVRLDAPETDRERNAVTFRASQDAGIVLCSLLPAHLRPARQDPEPTPQRPTLDRDAALALIDQHRPTFHRLRTAALHDYAQVERWTLPAHWNPGPHIDQPEPHRAADPYPDARLYGAPVEFAGDLIVCHWTTGTSRAEPTQEPNPMLDSLTMHVLEDRDDLRLHPGTSHRFLYLSPHAYDDEPVREAARRDLRRSVTDHAALAGNVVHPDEVTVTEATPAELEAAWRKHAPMNPPPLNVYALLGYWTPPRKDTRP